MLGWAHFWLSRSQSRPKVWVKCRLTVVAEESFGLFAFCWHEASYEVVSNGCQQDHQENNLSLTDRETERKKEVGRGSIKIFWCFWHQITPLLEHLLMCLNLGSYFTTRRESLIRVLIVTCRLKNFHILLILTGNNRFHNVSKLQLACSYLATVWLDIY